ncbi:MAG: dephospho-CoA kinase [Deltaproteobacteria bacterium]|nr:dephospho-CoA kinase [Deltaproteobacteria bacterium]
MLHVGLTGGIACGKSTIAKMLEAKGAYLFDLDVLTHFVEEPDRVAWKGIVEHFGPGILNEDRTINRARLGAIVFADRDQLEQLNRIVHPAVYDEWYRLVKEIYRKDPRAVVLSDVPLLIEQDLKSVFDVIAVVYISPDEQVERLIFRNRFNREEAETRVASQMSIDEKVRHADIVINNQGSVEDAQKTIDVLWQKLLEMEKQKHRKSPVPVGRGKA